MEEVGTLSEIEKAQFVHENCVDHEGYFDGGIVEGKKHGLSYVYEHEIVVDCYESKSEYWHVYEYGTSIWSSYVTSFTSYDASIPTW